MSSSDSSSDYHSTSPSLDHSEASATSSSANAKATARASTTTTTASASASATVTAVVNTGLLPYSSLLKDELVDTMADLVKSEMLLEKKPDDNEENERIRRKKRKLEVLLELNKLEDELADDAKRRKDK
ncbi:Cysteine synthase 2 [Mucor velutinosus]|uniref:Cysteine synthase 2 n=1 Tax=Mucor velutinosus TaxID=708070 RepID=A0AAN7HPX4_9FUNG|nr:Cysteine synthase 2 [Mucor velutinosus]